MGKQYQDQPITNMTRILAFFSLGIILLIAGIFMLDINFYLGVGAIGIGAVVAASFQMKFLVAMIQWSVKKGEENRKKRELRKLFGKSKKEPERVEGKASRQTSGAVRPEEAALMAAIEKQKQADPLIGAKIGGKEVLGRLLSAMKNDKGVHVESLFCALGALAGYACQANLREQAIARGMNPNAPFQVAKTANGKSYYFGDPLNSALAEGKLSVWSLAAGAAQHNGATSLPDINEIFQRTASNIGSGKFGIPNAIPGHAAGELPDAYLRSLWPALLPIVKKMAGDPMLWPLVYSFAIQEAMDMAKNTIPPHIALAIVMEAAIPMSKVELSSL